ncbi:MAG TPA: helix-turn-helix domain-containing protein [Vicinamibacterales bacterium]
MQVLTDTIQLAAALSPVRMRVLAQMHEPASATSLAPRLGLSRQSLNYHLRELEREGFVELVEERARRGCIERLLKVTSRAFVVDPGLLGVLADDPAQTRDRFSSTFLLATMANVIRDVAVLAERARAVEQPLATVTMDCEVRFESPASFRAFSDELARTVTVLAAKYNAASSHARRFRVVVGSHPIVTKSASVAAEEARRNQRARRARTRARTRSSR